MYRLKDPTPADILAALGLGHGVDLSDRLELGDPDIFEQRVHVRPETPGRFRVSSQVVFHDGSCGASTPEVETLDNEAIAQRIASLLASRLSWVYVWD